MGRQVIPAFRGGYGDRFDDRRNHYRNGIGNHDHRNDHDPEKVI